MNMNSRKFGGALRLGILGTLLGGSLLASGGSAFAAPFTAGNLIVYRVGTGTGALSSAATAVFLDEIDPTTNTLVQSIALSTTTATSGNRALTASGTATSEGLISRSDDGKFILLTGYNAAPGLAAVVGTTSAANERVIGRAAANGTIDTSTTTTQFSANNIRGASSSDGSNIYATGGNSGIILQTFAATGAGTIINATSLNNRQTLVSGGQLYISSAAGGSLGVYAVGSGTPTTSGQTITRIANAGSSPYGFFFADLDATPGIDTLYIADSSAGIQKFSLVSGSYVFNNSIALTGVTGITGVKSANGVTLYLSAPGAVSKLTDTSGYNVNNNGALSTVTTAGTNTAFRGIAFAPATTVAAIMGAIISQFRLSGPNGPTDEFIEIYNNTDTPLNVTGWNVNGSLATTTANPTLGVLPIPLTGTLPSRGHLLVTNAGGYSLGTTYTAGLSTGATPFATGDVVYGASGATAGADFALGSSLSLLNAQGTTVDTVNSTGTLQPDGTQVGVSAQYALVRRFETGSPTGGDSNFNLVSTGQTATNSDATGTAPFVNTGRLGAPGPRNSSSPVQNNRLAPLTVPTGITNQTAKYISSSSNYNSAASALSSGGQISIRRTVTNNTGVTATKLRFRLSALTAGTSGTAGAADLRAISSKSTLLNITGVMVNGLSLEAPSDQSANGGGLNSSWVTIDLTTNSITLTNNTTATGGLPAAAAANFEFLFGINAPGTYKAIIDVELLP